MSKAIYLILVSMVLTAGCQTIQRATNHDHLSVHDHNIKMKRWIALLEPLKYGKFFYCSNSGHYVMKDDPETVISSIKLALNDYDRIRNEKTGKE